MKKKNSNSKDVLLGHYPRKCNLDVFLWATFW